LNKFLIVGAGLVILIILGFVLLGNQGQQTTNVPVEPTTEIIEEESNSGIEQEEEEAGLGNVTLTSSGFSPSTLRIKAGTKVVWTNNSSVIATVDSVFHPTHRLYPFLNKGNFGPGETHEVTFAEAGTYTYHNHLNSAQTGTVIVE